MGERARKKKCCVVALTLSTNVCHYVLWEKKKELHYELGAPYRFVRKMYVCSIAFLGCLICLLTFCLS